MMVINRTCEYVWLEKNLLLCVTIGFPKKAINIKIEMNRRRNPDELQKRIERNSDKL